jgi:hypothetical protein
MPTIEFWGTNEQLELMTGDKGGKQKLKFLVFPDYHQFLRCSGFAL